MKKMRWPQWLKTRTRHFSWFALVFAMTVAGCKKELEQVTEPDDIVAADEINALGRGIRHTVVHCGESIQAAVNAAKEGTVIFIEPGVYKEDIEVDKPGIQLVGLGRFKRKVVIENPGDEEYGINVSENGDGFVLKNVTVQNFEEYGVFLRYVDHFILDHVISINNKEYGLFPVHCDHGSIRFCSATGSSDTGIYVGQSTNVSIEHCVAFGNVSGFEIENCTNASASWNEAYDNCAGISVFLLPGLPVKTSSTVRVSNNVVHHNNHVNFAPPEGGFETFIPSGAGMLLVGADNVTIEKNIIRNNNFVGVATVSTLVLGQLAGIPPENILADIDPYPEGTRIRFNIITQNGSSAPPGLPLPPRDILWDGSGINNCWTNNVFATAFPDVLPACN